MWVIQNPWVLGWVGRKEAFLKIGNPEKDEFSVRWVPTQQGRTIMAV